MALKYLGHFTGDLHQPLHVSFQDDRGGNSVDTTGLCGSNLHSAWDTCLLKKAVGTNPLAAAFALEAEITDADRAAWVATGPMDWANESFAIATAPATAYCVAGGRRLRLRAGQRGMGPGRAQAEGGDRRRLRRCATPIIRDRVKRAGVRLAHLLDRRWPTDDWTTLPAMAGERLAGRAHVLDGDTIVVYGIHVRLKGVAAPEVTHFGGPGSPAARGQALVERSRGHGHLRPHSGAHPRPAGRLVLPRRQGHRRGADRGGTGARPPTVLSGGRYAAAEVPASQELPFPAIVGRGSG